jgi:hypothetical protein
MGWLDRHLTEFVKPVLDYLPTLPTNHTPYFTPSEMSVIKNMWRSVKREARRLNKPLLLAGRDVFIFEILAQREGFPTVFRPDISRLTVAHIKEDYSKHFLFDTGFAGSIPRALKCQAFQMASAAGVEYMGRLYRKHVPLSEDTKQIFPRMRGSRSLVLKIEGTPKYWRRAFYRDPNAPVTTDVGPNDWYFYAAPAPTGKVDPITGIGQEFSPEEEFLKAALLTIEIYKDKSPSFTETMVPVTRKPGFTSYLD